MKSAEHKREAVRSFILCRALNTCLYFSRVGAYFSRSWEKILMTRINSQSEIKLPKMMIAEGVNPEDNEFSRGIIEVQEE
jgi:hypothetical protein